MSFFGLLTRSPNPAPVSPEPLDTLRHVTGQIFYQSGANNRTVPANYLLPHRVYVPTDGFHVEMGGNLPPGVTLPVSVAIQSPDGTVYPATFGGQHTTTLEGATRQRTDKIDVAVPAGSLIGIRIRYGVRSDGKGHPTGGAGWYGIPIIEGDADLTLAGSGAWPYQKDTPWTWDTSQTYVGKNGYGPCRPTAVYGYTAATEAAVLLIGDSITQSGSVSNQYDSYVINNTPVGTYAQRTLEGLSIPHVNSGLWGSIAYKEHPGPTPDIKAFTHVICAHGYNDMNQAASTNNPLQGVLNNIVTEWSWIKAENPDANIYQVTISPNTTSTDGWTTVEGQTPHASGPMRTQFNDWVRDGSPLVGGVATIGAGADAVRAGDVGHPLSGHLDIADEIMSERNSQKFRVDYGALTADGGHPNDQGHILMGRAIEQWAAAL